LEQDREEVRRWNALMLYEGFYSTRTERTWVIDSFVCESIHDAKSNAIQNLLGPVNAAAGLLSGTASVNCVPIAAFN
jgi:hypothetical protein